jgi:hypothetical protein
VQDFASANDGARDKSHHWTFSLTCSVRRGARISWIVASTAAGI